LRLNRSQTTLFVPKTLWDAINNSRNLAGNTVITKDRHACAVDQRFLMDVQPFIRATVAVVLLPGSNWAKRTCPP